jgi:membrane protease YdiL (CAAX protease family)
MVAQVVNTPWRYGVMIVLVWTTVAFGEEMQFRGFAFSRLERLFGGGRGGAAGALLGQALIFGLLHSYQGVGGMVSTSLLGLVLGGVFLISRRNLVACILLHGLMDTLSLTAVFYMATHAGTEI